MKLSLFLCVAGAAAVAPPRIELNLSPLQYKSATMTSDKAVGNAAPLDTNCASPSVANPAGLNFGAGYCTPTSTPAAFQQPDGTPVQFRRDWTQVCAAEVSSSDCPIPDAIAWDHNDKEVAVTKHIYLVDYDQQSTLPDGTALPIVVDSIDFNYRSTYLIKWDANDSAGNHAEQVVLQLRLNDVTAPSITWCGAPTDLEAAVTTSANRFCGTSTASDDIDNTVTTSITYSVDRCANDAGNGFTNGAPDSTLNNDGTACADQDTNTPLISRAALNTARNAVTLNVPGTYQITLHANDNAGTYGSGGVNNEASITRIIYVRDTLRPTITLNPTDNAAAAHTVAQECKSSDSSGSTYSDLGWTVYDLLDTAALGKTLALTPDKSDLDVTAIGDYNITYDVTDTRQNDALTQYRTIQVRDTTPPSIQVITVPGEGSMIHAQHRVTRADRDEAYAGYADYGALAVDSCDTTVGPKTAQERTDGDCASGEQCVSTTWDRTPECGTNVGSFGGSYTDGDSCLGTYELTYTVKDLSGHEKSKTRTVTFIDREAPILTLVGEPEFVVEASTEGSYVELGATCHDYVGGDITPARVITAGSHDGVSTGPVDYTTTGVYVVDYNCRDASHNNADTIHRTVRVVDTTPPTIQLRCAECDVCDGGVHQDATVDGYTKGNWTFNETLCTCPDEELEAGFNYVEQGACAIDTLDGITGKYLDEETGSMVDSGDIYISGSVDHLTPNKIGGDANAGVYYIYYDTQDKHGSHYNDDNTTTVVTSPNNATQGVRKITVKDTLPPVISLHMQHASGLATPFHVSRGHQEGLHDVVNPAGSWLPDSQRQAQQAIQDDQGLSGGNPHLRGAAQGVPTHSTFNLDSFMIGRMPASIDMRSESGGDLAKVTPSYDASAGH